MKQNSNSRTTRTVPPTKGVRPQWRLVSVLVVLGAGGLACLHFAKGNHRLSTAPETIVAETKQDESPATRSSHQLKHERREVPARNHAGPSEVTSVTAPQSSMEVRQRVSSLVELDLK